MCIYLFIWMFIYCGHSILSVCMHTEEGTRPQYRWLWTTTWLLGLELRTSGRARSATNHWAVSPAPSSEIFNSRKLPCSETKPSPRPFVSHVTTPLNLFILSRNTDRLLSSGATLSQVARNRSVFGQQQRRNLTTLLRNGAHGPKYVLRKTIEFNVLNACVRGWIALEHLTLKIAFLRPWLEHHKQDSTGLAWDLDRISNHLCHMIHVFVRTCVFVTDFIFFNF